MWGSGDRLAPSFRLPKERKSQESVHRGSSNVGRPRQQGYDPGESEMLMPYLERQPHRRVRGKDYLGGVASGR